jgi:hypothetical protein
MFGTMVAFRWCDKLCAQSGHGRAFARPAPQKQKNMDLKTRLLTPLIVAAAASVVAFAGIGVAAITGHLSVTQMNHNPLAGLTGLSSAVAAPETKGATTAVSRAQKAEARNAAAKPMDFRPGNRVGGKKQRCADCGVVDSIRAREVEQDAAALMRASLNGDSEGDGLRTAGGTTYPAVKRSALDSRVAVNFVVTVRMEDGTVRTIYENQRPILSIGERVRLVNGAVIPLG